jgi:outer membrane protein W
MIRKSRQDAEVKTEQKIVEKLEFSRLEDEKRRSDVLFGDKWQQMNTQNTQQVIVPAQPVVVQEQIVAAPKVVAEPEEEVDEELIRNEVRASLAEIQAEKPQQKKGYFAGGVGITEYIDVDNVRNNYSLGFAVGSRVSERLLVEGSFSYGNYEIEQRDGFNYCDYYGCDYYNRITDMDQYSGAATVKYQLFNGVFRPVFGGTLAYTYRTFADNQFGIENNDAQSHALDMGVVAGADFELSEDFSLGLEFKYMFLNFLNRKSNRFSRGFSQTTYGNETPIERLNQMSISVFGRATF